MQRLIREIREYMNVSQEEMAKMYDVIVGSIANDRMFYVLDNFFLGNITDQALVMSLSALQLGEQYVAITEKACSHAAIEAEIALSDLERVFLRDVSESNRVKGVNLANEICKNYRREGLFFDEILKNGSAEGRTIHRGLHTTEAL